MGTFVETAYIERLHEDIEIACRRLEEQCIDTLVVAVSEDSHHILGSQKGQLFLEQKYRVVAEFVHFCKDYMQIKSEKETITLFDEQGKAVKLQESGFSESVDLLETPVIADTEPALPSNPDIGASPEIPALQGSEPLLEGSSQESEGNTEISVVAEADEQLTIIKSDADIKPLKDERPENSQNKRRTRRTKKSSESQREGDTTIRRTLRSGKSIKTTNVVENLPRVKAVISKVRNAENSKEQSKVNVQKSKVTNVKKTGLKKDLEISKAICEKAKSASKSQTDSKEQVKSNVAAREHVTVKTEEQVNRQKQIQCIVCKDKFDSMEELKNHMALHKALACHMCKKVFKTKDALEEHIQEHKDKNEYHKCEQCDQVFKFTWQLGEHVEKVHKCSEEEDGEYPCNLCGHLFRRQLQLEEHNERNKMCALNTSEVQSNQNPENALLSEIHFTDLVTGLPKKKTVKELMEKRKLPATCEVCLKKFDKLYNFKRHVLHHSQVKPHKCVTCGQCFHVEENLKKHDRLHELRPYYCKHENCLRRFESKTRLEHHLRFTCKKASEKPDLVCKECGHKAQSVHAMESHKRKHTGVKAFSCDICGKQLATKESIERHKLVFHQEERPWECEQCGKRFKIKDTLKKHEKTHGEKKYRCEVCGKLWHDNCDLRKHMKTHAEVREKNYICDVCGKAYGRKIYLDCHRRIHTGEMPFKCDLEICGKGCVESGNLKKHMMTHTKEKPFICDVCGKAYGRRSLLDNHQRLHTGEKPYICDIEGCDKAFRSYGNLKQHKANHVQGHSFICDICGKTFKLKSRMNHHRKSHIVEHRWPCDFCDQKFKSIFMYKNHLAKTHPERKKEIEERTNIRLYQCHICQKMYGDKEDLTRHIYIHKGLKPFKCGFCGKAFNDKSNMKCHERIHTGEKKLSCGRCYKTFLQPRMLRLHMKNVHGRVDDEELAKIEEEAGMKDESYIPEHSYKVDSFTADQECQTAVEHVLNVESGPPILLDMRSVSQAVIAEPTQAVIAQPYPSHSLTQSSQLFPQLVKDFEPLMIVENY